ncbi:hypothetical protein Pcinc_005116 [Petrolisthes cinctipes]|uniref:Uncharacterized protein n=1 Tax=Petrolisthes cinctipes TaxID=88211 RepID=A0AAE1KZN2_PETCI|nr:hypothetical protein Pcinc_005116 [Petrolisthes cinctipes]
MGGCRSRIDLSTSREEADNIIVQQTVHIAVSHLKPVTVLSDDTDVYVILLYHYLQQGLQTSVVIESSPIKGISVIAIKATVQKHHHIIPTMLSGHALTDCDTAAACYGIGKVKMLNVLKRGASSQELIGNVEAEWPNVLEQATRSKLWTAKSYIYVRS